MHTCKVRYQRSVAMLRPSCSLEFVPTRLRLSLTLLQGTSAETDRLYKERALCGLFCSVAYSTSRMLG